MLRKLSLQLQTFPLRKLSQINSLVNSINVTNIIQNPSGNREEETFFSLFCDSFIILIQKSNKDIIRKEYYRSILPMNRDAKMHTEKY